MHFKIIIPIISAVSAVGSSSGVVGSLSVVEKAISPQCGIKLLLQNQTIFNSCGLTIDQFSSIVTSGKLSQISENQYFQLCQPQCQQTFGQVQKLVSSSECASQVFDEGQNLTGSKIANYLEIATNILCLKTQDQNGFCLFEQLPTLEPVLTEISQNNNFGEYLKILITNNKVACNDCIKQEVSVISSLNLTSDFDQNILKSVNTFNSNYGTICLFGTATINAEPFNFTPLPPVPTTTSTVSESTSTTAIVGGPGSSNNGSPSAMYHFQSSILFAGSILAFMVI